MSDPANLNFRIALLRTRMRAMQADIRLLTSAGQDCRPASERLRRTQAELLAVIAQRAGHARAA